MSLISKLRQVENKVKNMPEEKKNEKQVGLIIRTDLRAGAGWLKEIDLEGLDSSLQCSTPVQNFSSIV